MKVRFRCGHDGHVKDGQSPVCVCGERGIARSYAPAPRIVGKATGPLVTTQDLAPSAGAFVESRLVLKEQSDDKR